MSAAPCTPRQWFIAPPRERRRLYYRCMREVYGMTASEALEHTRRMFRAFPKGDLVAAVRAAIAKVQEGGAA